MVRPVFAGPPANRACGSRLLIALGATFVRRAAKFATGNGFGRRKRCAHVPRRLALSQPFIDGQSVADFEAGLSNNLYKLWNRLASGATFLHRFGGSIFRRAIARQKPDHWGFRRSRTGLPRKFVKRYLEPILEPIFHEGSYGYRPGRSAIDAVRKARQRCWRYDWVLDVDVRSYFDSIDWELLLKAVRKHTDCPWVLLYIERWLKAPVRMEDGRIVPRMAGTPQGGVVSPACKSVPALRLRHVDGAGVSRHSVREVRGRSHLPLPKRRRGEGTMERFGGPLRGLQAGAAPAEDKARLLQGCNRRGDYPISRLTFLGYEFRPRSQSGMVVNSAFRSCPRLVQER